jgi:tagatose-6-phosphate ketose/aldose isomerase
MSSIAALASMPAERIAGSLHTVREINQQPGSWLRVLDVMESRAAELDRFLRDAGAMGKPGASVILCGAGSSDHIGRAVAPSLRARLGWDANAVATTRLVTHPGAGDSPGRPLLCVHFARSGDSPESLATYRFMKRLRPDGRHLVITCNKDGVLCREAVRDPRALVVTLPPETNDRSLAMTSSYTSMELAALCLARGSDWERFRDTVAVAADAARGVLADADGVIHAFGQRRFERACYLGSDALEGAMTEGALKMLEMTAGSVAACSHSFLGVRHGPQVFIDARCVVVACLSSDPRVREYEMDLLRELRAKGQGAGVLAVTAAEDPGLPRAADAVVRLSPHGIPDELRVLTDVAVCQILALHASRGRGLAPDNPSGIISRVVQGVVIHDPEGRA